MKNRILFLLGLFVGLFSISAKADYLQEEINRIKEDIVVIQRQLYRDKNDMTAAPQESVSNVQVRLGEYDQMIRDMNGKVENLEYRLNSLEKKLGMLDKDIELRFSQMQQKLGSAVSPSGMNTKTPAKSPDKVAITVAPKDLYEQALTDLKNNKLSDSEKKFSQFLTSYPKDALAGNAQYWLGEVYYKQKNYAKAAVAFKEGYSNYPEGTKGPDCLLKLGLSMKALDKREEACTAFVNLPALFAKANSEISTRAKKEAEELGCK